ncbi:DNA polymerase III subunit alpha [bacterium AH-315-F18]|nr:DNA polymerase III subunit alpha [bacterium AH-315-F18]
MSKPRKVSDFVHLHVHSHYSLLDGTAQVHDLVQRAVDHGMTGLALTDHGNMFGAMELYSQCKKADITPIVGIETYVANGDHLKRGQDERGRHHLTLLAKNAVGFKNLCKLSSKAFIDGFYYKPRIDKKLLAEYSEGLIGLSGCIKGEIPGHLLRGDYAGALASAGEYRDIFKPGDFYLEVMDHGIDIEARAMPDLIKVGKDLDIKVLATQDVHYLDQHHALNQEVLVCIHQGRCFSDPNRLKFSTDTLHFRSEAEMHALFPDDPEFVLNTREVAEKVNLELDLGGRNYHLPVFETPDGSDQVDYFRRMCRIGLKKRFGVPSAEATKRLEMEMQVIEEMGFPAYFLIVQDFIQYAKDRDIPVGPGRGSAAGSIVAYALNITDLDPLKYNLLFERFLNSHRVSMPDIDIDFCQDGREEVINYVREKYGRDCVAQIITFGTLKARGVIRDVGRVYEMPLHEVDRLAKMVPEGPKATLRGALDEVEEFREAYDTDPTARKVLDLALGLEGLARQTGKHAAGVVISDLPLTEYVPLYKDTRDEAVATAFPMAWIEDLGLLKMDFLGLRTLSIIKLACRLVKEEHGVELDMLEIPLDDKKTFELFQRGDSYGVFQFESDGMRGLLTEAMPDRFEDLIALNALYRPGPMDLIPSFCARKHGREEITYFHDIVKPVLEETYGIIIYQEQVMLMANKLAGFSLNEADSLRKAMGKKKPEIMEKFSKQFVAGCMENGVKKKAAEEIWVLLVKFAGYGFNKSHSAAYSFVAYQTAYLKANYTTEFMAALISFELIDVEKAVTYIDEARQLGIEVMPPDVQHSRWDFRVVEGKIRYGLGAIKGVGRKAVEAIGVAREDGDDFTSLFDFCERVDLSQCNKKILECLISSGAMDAMPGHRAQQLAALERAMKAGASAQADRRSGQMSLFGAPPPSNDPAIDVDTAFLPDVPEWTDKELLVREKETLGHYLSNHPLATCEAIIRRFTTTNSGTLGTVPDRRAVRMGGLVVALRPILTKKGKPMGFLTLEDQEGKVDVVLFPSVYAEQRHLCVPDAIVVVEGKASYRGDRVSILADRIVPLDEVRETFAAKLELTVGLARADSKKLLALRDILKAHAGTVPLSLCMVDEYGQRLRLAVENDLCVRPDEACLLALEELLGKDSVAFQAKPAQATPDRKSWGSRQPQPV